MLLRIDHLWRPEGWLSPAFVQIDAAGCVASISGELAPGERESEHVRGYVLPGMPNLHSHAFQRAMAGLAERASSVEESFWTWRDVMYEIALRVSPDDLEAIATELYVEMLEAGYTSVAEFHYLHKAPDGTLYDDPAELSLRIARAAEHTGIGLTWLGVLYQHSGFGGVAATSAQRRFVLELDELLTILERVRTAHPGVRLGVAPHSLRAVSTETIARLVAALGDDGAPVHIHIAEQEREVEECVSWCKKRPIELLFERVAVDARFCLVHATHVGDGELDAIARSRAIVGLCPSTEANLGDGIFPLARFLARGGRWGIGSDSHATIDPIEELRLLEYGQRLSQRRRMIAGDGARLWSSALAGGAAALAQPTGSLEPGQRADLIVLDPNHPALVERPLDRVVDALVFASSASSPVRDVMVGGRWVVVDGRHHARGEALTGFRAALARLA